VGGAGQSLFQTLLNFMPIDAPFALADLYITPVISPCARSWLDLELRIYARQDGNIQDYLRCPPEVFTGTWLNAWPTSTWQFSGARDAHHAPRWSHGRLAAPGAVRYKEATAAWTDLGARP
jgi:hypothetical protein